MSARYLLRTDRLRELLDARHQSHQRVVRQLRLSRSYWSQLLNRRRHLTTEMRARILECPAFQGVKEEDLWTVDRPKGATA